MLQIACEFTSKECSELKWNRIFAKKNLLKELNKLDEGNGLEEGIIQHIEKDATETI